MKKLIETQADFSAMVEDLKNEEIIAADIEATDIDLQKLVITGLGLGTSSKQYYLPFSKGKTDLEVLEGLKTLFLQAVVVFHNAKYDLEVLRKFNLPIPEKIEDTLIMSWLLDETTPNGLKYLTKNLLDREVIEFKEVDQRVNLFRDEKDILCDMADYCMDDVKNTFDLYDYFLPRLKEQGLDKAYYNIERPFIGVLVDMEMRGVQLDIAWFSKKKEKLAKVLKSYEEKLKKLSGEDLNIHSPQQLEKYLFNGLGYVPPKVTPIGNKSTDNEALEELVKQYSLTEEDFVPNLLIFRDLDKIYTTYLVGLLEKAAKDGVIHTSFLQHGTATGRLSSNAPNCQNIPSRGDEWDVRRGFIPRKGYRFLVSDYSQIELRVLAHFSKDKNMVETFMNDGDIHAKTMELTGLNRRAAKIIIYGMGPRTLAQNLGIKEDEAKRYIEKFFAGYPSVRGFINLIQQSTIERGYVTMITGRRRRFYNFKDNQWYNLVKRQAFNSRIQGSASDIIKIAMIKLNRALKPFDSHLLLQIHDEVVIEVPEGKVKEVKEIVKETMETAVKLNVPLKVNTEEGDYWVKG